MILFLPLIFSKIASMMYLLLSSLLSAGTYLSKKSWHLLAESIGHFLLRQFHILWLCGFPVLEALSSLLSVFFLPVYFQNSFSLFFFLSWKSWSLVNLFSPDNLIHTHDFDSEPYWRIPTSTARYRRVHYSDFCTPLPVPCHLYFF